MINSRYNQIGFARVIKNEYKKNIEKRENQYFIC